MVKCVKMAKRHIYSSATLQNLINQKHSCVSLVKCEKKIGLHPIHLNDIKAGVWDILYRSLKKYDHSLNGIAMGYQNVKIIMDKNTGKICGRSGEFEVNITLDYFIFQPRIGSYLEGVVNKKSNNHIGCLVHRYFNATLLKPEDVDYEDWICKDVAISNQIVFKVVDLDFTGPLPYIEGTLETNSAYKSQKSTKDISTDNEESYLEIEFSQSSISNEMNKINKDDSSSVPKEKSQKEKRKKKISIDEQDNALLTSTQLPLPHSFDKDFDFDFLSPVTFEDSPQFAKKKKSKEKKKAKELQIFKTPETTPTLSLQKPRLLDFYDKKGTPSKGNDEDENSTLEYRNSLKCSKSKDDKHSDNASEDVKSALAQNSNFSNKKKNDVNLNPPTVNGEDKITDVFKTPDTPFSASNCSKENTKTAKNNIDEPVDINLDTPKLDRVSPKKRKKRDLASDFLPTSDEDNLINKEQNFELTTSPSKKKKKKRDKNEVEEEEPLKHSTSDHLNDPLGSIPKGGNSVQEKEDSISPSLVTTIKANKTRINIADVSHLPTDLINAALDETANLAKKKLKKKENLGEKDNSKVTDVSKTSTSNSIVQDNIHSNKDLKKVHSETGDETPDFIETDEVPTDKKNSADRVGHRKKKKKEKYEREKELEKEIENLRAQVLAQQKIIETKLSSEGTSSSTDEKSVKKKSEEIAFKAGKSPTKKGVKGNNSVESHSVKSTSVNSIPLKSKEALVKSTTTKFTPVKMTEKKPSVCESSDEEENIIPATQIPQHKKFLSFQEILNKKKLSDQNSSDNCDSITKRSGSYSEKLLEDNSKSSGSSHIKKGQNKSSEKLGSPSFTKKSNDVSKNIEPSSPIEKDHKDVSKKSNITSPSKKNQKHSSTNPKNIDNELPESLEVLSSSEKILKENSKSSGSSHIKKGSNKSTEKSGSPSFAKKSHSMSKNVEPSSPSGKDHKDVSKNFNFPSPKKKNNKNLIDNEHNTLHGKKDSRNVEENSMFSDSDASAKNSPVKIAKKTSPKKSDKISSYSVMLQEQLIQDLLSESKETYLGLTKVNDLKEKNKTKTSRKRKLSGNDSKSGIKKKRSKIDKGNVKDPDGIIIEDECARLIAERLKELGEPLDTKIKKKKEVSNKPKKSDKAKAKLPTTNSTGHKEKAADNETLISKALKEAKQRVSLFKPPKKIEVPKVL